MGQSYQRFRSLRSRRYPGACSEASLPALIPFDETHLPALVALLPEAAAGQDLGRDLRDAARGHGRQVVVAVEAGRPSGVLGWVSFGVAVEGIVYGVPLLAQTEAAAERLLRHLLGVGRSLGARQLRVSRFPGEGAKERALRALGFSPRLDMVSVERPSAGLPLRPMPPHLTRVPLGEVDWERFAGTFNRIFAEVPNTPPMTGAALREEWTGFDAEASGLWQDPEGRYVAWLGAHPDGDVEVLGLDESLRGRGLGEALYGAAAAVLAARGVTRLRALLASTNQATLRLHAKLGFQEYARRTVHAHDLAGG